MNAVTNRPLCLTVPILLIALCGTLRAAPGDVKASFDAPCKYPSGLASDGKRLFVADWRSAKIHEVASVDGKVTRSWDAPTLKPHGLAYARGKLFVSDDHTGNIYALNLDSGIVETTFQAPHERATGLALADGTLFILAKHKIYKVLPDDGTILGYFAVPEKSSRCLTHDGKYLWVSDRIKNEFYMVDPDSGKVVSILASPGPYAAGIAWADGHLWNVDFQTRKLYKIAIRDEQPYRLSDTRRARVEYLWALNNYGPGTITDLTLNVAMPMELPNQKLLTDPAFSRPPSKRAHDRWGQACAVFEIGSVPAGTKAAVTYEVNAEVSAIRYLIIPENAGTLEDIPRDIRENYTVDGSHYRIDAPYIQDTAKRIIGDEKNTYWIARKIYDFIIDSLEYEMVGGWDVPEVVLKRGSGSCSEYTYSFVALCRAAGLPARYQGSVVVRGDDASVDKAFHRWAQVYLPGHGWVPVDANRGDKESPADQARGFGGLANRFLITTEGGGDSEYLNWGYNSFASCKSVGYCNVEEDNLGFFEPLESDDAPSLAGDAQHGECTGKSR
ncbi:MAG: transglutaminase domain-containing protein [Planctomycetota bacterium]|jgi:outer membrane protein assembly factor BamB